MNTPTADMTATLAVRYADAMLAYFKHPTEQRRRAMLDAEILFRASRSDDMVAQFA